MQKILSLLKTRNFWVNLTAFCSFILPMLSTSEHLRYLHMQLGITYGIPTIILVYVVFYFIDKKKNERIKGLELQDNNIKKRVPLELKVLLVLFFNANNVGNLLLKPIISSPVLEQWLSVIIMLGVPVIFIYFISQEIHYRKRHQIKTSHPVVLVLVEIVLVSQSLLLLLGLPLLIMGLILS